jgi:hypothetical protein
MEVTLSAAGSVKGGKGTLWNLNGSGLGRAALRGAALGADYGTTLLSCVLDLRRSPTVVSSGILTLTVPNGDKLRGRFEGHASLPDATGFIDLDAELTLIEGTGRFQGVEGFGRVTGTVNTTRRTFCITGLARLDLARHGLLI